MEKLKNSKMNIDKTIEWLQENGYNYNISNKGETYNSFNADSTGTTWVDFSSDRNKTYRTIEDKETLLKECIEEAVKLGRPYMRKYDYDSEDKPTQQEWELAISLFNHRINGGAN